MSVIELKDVSKSYGQGDAKVNALKNINFEAQKGEVVLIEGPSGAGKSTFLTIAGALQKPTSGEVFIGGDNVTNYSPKQADALRLDKIGFVLQAYNLVPYLTVREQFILVDKVKKTGNLSKEALDGLLDELGISQLVNKYPKELSGGQQQRVAIARALAMNPEMLFFDEPTSALDPEITAGILKVLRQLADEKMTMIIVTHEIAFARKVADRVIFMDGGVIVEQGRPEDVIDNPSNERTRAFLQKMEK